MPRRRFHATLPPSSASLVTTLTCGFPYHSHNASWPRGGPRTPLCAPVSQAAQQLKNPPSMIWRQCALTCRAALPTYSIGMRLLHRHKNAHTLTHTHTHTHGGHAASRRSHGKWRHFSYGNLSLGEGFSTFSTFGLLLWLLLLLLLEKFNALFFCRPSAPLRRQYLQIAQRGMRSDRRNMKTLLCRCFSCRFLPNKSIGTERTLWPKSNSSCQLCFTLAMRGFLCWSTF